jgi:hypothetical protein
MLLELIAVNQIAREEAERELAEKQAELAELKGEKVEAKEAPKNKEKKNHKVGKPVAGREYVLLMSKLVGTKIPDQQRDIALILAKGMEVGKRYSEAEVFNLLIDQSGEYPSIYKSVQDPTYLFRYYRGLGEGRGFISRDFLRMYDQPKSDQPKTDKTKEEKK